MEVQSEIVTPVDRMELLTEPKKEKEQMQPDCEPYKKTFDELKVILGEVFVPKHIPKGFKLSSSRIFPGSQKMCQSLYLRKDGTGVIAILQVSGQSEIKVPPGQYKTVSVGPSQATIVNGTWVRRLMDVKESGPVSLQWDPRRPRTLYMRRDKWIVAIIAFFVNKDLSISDSELINIGESLEAYKKIKVKRGQRNL
ncbi:MAG: hypothetical protein HWN68_17145 [Desulfobacterales bacterium]|nr:hypothetical protein [Desulfobacterales bacterium]